MVKATICGAAGRMGKTNIAVFHESENSRVVGATESGDSPHVGSDAGMIAGIGEIGVPITSRLGDVLEDTQVVVDFSQPAASIDNLEIASRHGIPCVIGTTGFDNRQLGIIREASARIPVLHSPNMSRGVNVLFYLVEKAVKLLGLDYESEITEIHHNRKKDSPSGTALELGRIIALARGQDFEESAVYGRRGGIGPRSRREIGIHSLRASDVVGEHEVLLCGPGERIEIAHRSGSRMNYARGALSAAEFVCRQKKGLFTMADVIGFSTDEG
jgi:4-hydroxy-tetrahydrodipicolinate reductase